MRIKDGNKCGYVQPTETGQYVWRIVSKEARDDESHEIFRPG